MKILSAERIRQLDAYTISSESIASADLMERAAQAFVGWFCARFGSGHPVSVFCGPGNNGGDGLAIARLLSGKGYSLEVFTVTDGAKVSPDSAINLDRLRAQLRVNSISAGDLPAIGEDRIVIDALLGSGLSRPVQGLMGEVISHINASGARVVSVDIASGLRVDTANAPSDLIIRPEATVSFQLPKLSFLMPRNEAFTGKWEVVDIGLSREFIEAEQTSYFYTDELVVKELTRKRPKFSHKGTFGHALIIAGSYGKIGAAFLAGKACLRSGAGLLTLNLPGCGYQVLQSSLPEAMVTADPEDRFISALPDTGMYSAIGAGPGLGRNEATVQMLDRLLTGYRGPLVLDADALNILSEHPRLLDKLPEHTVLTPHPKEFERLAGPAEDHFRRLDKLRDFAARHQVIVCLKGANTAVALEDGRVFFNSTGNPGMATGGTGDVLTGIITGLLAQGYAPGHAAVLGVYKHGEAGDRAARARSEAALLASDIIEELR